MITMDPYKKINSATEIFTGLEDLFDVHKRLFLGHVSDASERVV